MADAAQNKTGQGKAHGRGRDVPLVAIGASAGGLEPLEHFFESVPEAPGMAFVVVQHLSPDYRSMMNELLGRRSSLQILHIEDGMELQPNTVYLNQPNEYVDLDGTTFRTEQYQASAGLPHLPIDRFFVSLVQRDPARTVAVVLSGSGSDGAHGAKTLHDAGAAVLVQSMQQAAFASMPRAVLVLGSVDRVLDADQMPAVIQDIFANGKGAMGVDAPDGPSDQINQILGLLEARHNVDFNHYKRTNVTRRIIRRMHLLGHATLQEYHEILSENDQALTELFHDMLIGVTEFYRDPEAIASLRKNVLDPLAQDLDATTPIKVWVPACASGEEVYTLAIELSEALREAGNDRKFRFIGTDIHAESIEIASRGVYSADKLEHVTPDLRERYFHETSDGYVIDPVLRQKIIFSTHNLTNDPPFMNLDLVSCRNLLIYLEEEPQASAISMFIFGLMRNAHLFLGAAETVGKFKTAFEVVDARWRIFRKIDQSTRFSQSSLSGRRFPTTQQPKSTGRTAETRSASAPAIGAAPSRDMLVRSYDVLLKRYAPSSILMTNDGQVLNWFGAAEICIDTMNNLADWTVQEIVHPDLHFAINVGIEKLRMGNAGRHTRRVSLDLADRPAQECQVTVEPLGGGSGLDLVLVKVDFTADSPRVEGESPQDTAPTTLQASDEDANVLTQRVHSLERDLRLTEETLQHVTERLEASGEELQASNEELQASNEELQASNEELQSSNEELHAVNEELLSVSSEHERKIEMLSELNENTEIVLKLLQTGLILLDEDDRIHRISRLVEREFLLQEHDIGRAIATVAPRLDFTDLVTLTAQLRDTGQPQIAKGEHEGRPLSVELRPLGVTTGRASPIGARSHGTILLFRWG